MATDPLIKSQINDQTWPTQATPKGVASAKKGWRTNHTKEKTGDAFSKPSRLKTDELLVIWWKTFPLGQPLQHHTSTNPLEVSNWINSSYFTQWNAAGNLCNKAFGVGHDEMQIFGMEVKMRGAFWVIGGQQFHYHHLFLLSFMHRTQCSQLIASIVFETNYCQQKLCSLTE